MPFHFSSREAGSHWQTYSTGHGNFLTGIPCSDGSKIINIDSIVGYPHPKSVTDTGNEGALVYPVQEHMQEHLQSML